MSSIGESLAEERRRQGKSIADVEAATRVRGRLLQALERGDHSSLPSPAYVKGYIQAYAKFLEIDAAPLLEQYQDEVGPVLEKLRVPRPVMPARTERPQRNAHLGVAPSPKGWLVAVGFILLITVLLSAAALIGGKSEDRPMPQTAEPKTETTGTPALAEPSSPATPSVTETTPAGEGGEAAEGAPQAEPVSNGPFDLKVEIKADSRSWLRAVVDGETEYEGILESGQTREWTVTEEATLRIGNGDGVRVTRDGRHVPIPPSEDVSVVTLDASE